MKPHDFRLERYFARHEFSAPHLLCASDCESFATEEILELEPGAAEPYLSLRLGYTESMGRPELRRAIAGLYTSIGADDVLVFSGAEEAIFAFMNVLAEPGMNVLVPHPAYQSIQEIPRSVGAEVRRVALPTDRSWQLEADDYLRHVDSRTRILVINCPHNPTGGMMAAAEFEALVRAADKRSVTVFSDEVYRLLEYDPANRLPAACDCSRSAVSLGVMSKAFGLAGLRIGWLATHNHELLERIAAFKDYTTICSSAPSEFLAGIALRRRRAILERNRDIIDGNIRLVDGFMDRWKELISWVRPLAGAIAFPELLGDIGAEAFCRDAICQAGVLLLPSSVYDFGDRHLRIGFGRRTMPESLEHLHRWLERRFA